MQTILDSSSGILWLFSCIFSGPLSEPNLIRISPPRLSSAQMKTIHYISRWPAWDVCALKPGAPTLPTGRKPTPGPRHSFLWGFPAPLKAVRGGWGWGSDDWVAAGKSTCHVCSETSFVTGHTPTLFLPSSWPYLAPRRVTQRSGWAQHIRCLHTQTDTHRDCNSMVECIIDGSALKDPLLIL